MKIKHFAGYGIVDAKKISKTTSKNILNEDIITLKIRVSGNHEWGLERDDIYDLYNWLVKRFDKSVASYQDIIDYSMNDYYLDKIGEYGMNIEVCDYTFKYKK